MDLIQSALDRGVSKASQKNLFVVFGPFFTSVDSFEVARLVKKRRNFDLDLSFIHVTFSQNWKYVFLLRLNFFGDSDGTVIVTNRFLWV